MRGNLLPITYQVPPASSWPVVAYLGRGKTLAWKDIKRKTIHTVQIPVPCLALADTAPVLRTLPQQTSEDN